MFTIHSFGEITYNGQAALIENDSGDFTVSLNTASSVFELRFDKEVAKSFFIVSPKDPYLDDAPYVTVAAERENTRGYRVATLRDGTKPEFIRGFGFWFIATRLKICQDEY